MKLVSTTLLAALSLTACEGTFFERFQNKNGDFSQASARLAYLIITEDGGFYDESSYLGGGLRVRLLVGNDPQLDGDLDDEDVLASILDVPTEPQTDTNGDGVHSFNFQDEADPDNDREGFFSDGAEPIGDNLSNGLLPLGEYDLFAIEVLDASGQPVLWKDSLSGVLATRIAYDPCEALNGYGTPRCAAEEAEFQKFFVSEEYAGKRYSFGVNTSYTLPNGDGVVAPHLFIYLPASAVE